MRSEGEGALREALARWRGRPQANGGPLEAIILAELGRVRGQIEALEQLILVRLYLSLDSRFDEQELRSLCFALGVEYDSLPAVGKSARLRELIAHLHRRGRLAALIEHYHRLRPEGGI